MYKFIVFVLLISFKVQADSFYQFGYQYYQRLNTPVGGSKNKGFLLGNLNHEKKFEKISTKAEFDFRYYPHSSLGVYSLPEAYLHKKGEFYDFHLGRKIIDFAPSEKFWMLGEINPIRGFNLLEQNQEGLMGAHLDLHFKRSNLTLLASMLHVPQMNPTYKIANGKISAANEWSKLPPSKARFNGQDMAIYYNLVEPDVDRIIIHPTLGGRYNYEWSEKSGAQFFALLKPEPMIRINATGFYEQNTVERATVFAKPFVNQHVIIGGDLHQKFNYFSMRSGLWYIDPKKGSDPDFNFTSLKIQPTFNTEQYFFTTLEGDFNHLLWAIQGIELISRDNRSDDLFAKTSKWRRALGLSMDYVALEKHIFGFNYRQDFEMDDQLLKGEWDYNFYRSAHLILGFELLFSPSSYSYWSPYRSNDSLYTQLNYVF